MGLIKSSLTYHQMIYIYALKLITDGYVEKDGCIFYKNDSNDEVIELLKIAKINPVLQELSTSTRDIFSHNITNSIKRFSNKSVKK